MTLKCYAGDVRYISMRDGLSSRQVYELEEDADGFVWMYTNTGHRAGAEVVQAYVRDLKSSVKRPFKELKAFGKVNVEPGCTEKVTLTLDKSAFAFYDPADRQWTIEPGKFEILIGTSSGNIVKKIPGTIETGRKWLDSDHIF